MVTLVENTLLRIKQWHAKWPKAAVLWSGGKDSTVLLHLLRFKTGISLPVVQYREPAFRERYAYSDRLIKEWDLEVYDYPASKHALADGPDVTTGEMRFDLLKYQQWGANSVVLSLGTERPKAGEKFLCGVDFLQRPTGTFNWPWEAVYLGTKGGDCDPIKGQVPLAVDVRHAAGSPVSLYPLRDWSDEQIFAYLEEQGVEPDPNRYEKTQKEWKNRADKSANADYIPTCLNCIDRHAGPYAECPKLRATISNISHLVPYEDIVFKDLGFRPVWKNGTAQDLSLPGV